MELKGTKETKLVFFLQMLWFKTCCRLRQLAITDLVLKNTFYFYFAGRLHSLPGWSQR